MPDAANNKRYRMTDEKLQETADRILYIHEEMRMQGVWTEYFSLLALRELILREIERRAEVRRAYEQVIGQLVGQGKEDGDA